MSGGFFQYNQYRIDQIAEAVEQVIEDNDSKELDQWGCTRGRGYSPETIERFKDGLRALRIAYVYAQRMDWLLSDDDGEESFHQRLAHELEALK
jgi:hypothetical protein